MELMDSAWYVFVEEVLIFEDAYWCCRLRVTKSLRLMVQAHPLRLLALLLLSTTLLLITGLLAVVLITTALLLPITTTLPRLVPAHLALLPSLRLEARCSLSAHDDPSCATPRFKLHTLRAQVLYPPTRYLDSGDIRLSPEFSGAHLG